VKDDAIHLLKRLCAGLCLLLTLVFAGTSTANALDSVQHLPGGTAQHVHSPLSIATITFEDDHHVADYDAGHHDDDADDDHRGPDQQPGHHHHADGNSGLPAFAASDAALAMIASDRPALSPDTLPLGLTLHGPERPPKASTRTA
jgi:hypothetical protein